MKNKTYIAIDLKSFYASVECVERDLDPMTTNLVVADKSRTEKTICLAVSPTLKKYGLSGRSRLFEVVQKMKEVNQKRRQNISNNKLEGSSYNATELESSPELSVDYIAATPQMSHYIKCSTEIYNVYLKYVAAEDIHVYSIDEVFIDATSYLDVNKFSPREFAVKIILDVQETTGIPAAAGIGTNLYLSKVAMDIGAKHAKPDENGVRIAELDEMTYRKTLWEHEPITDFWRVGRGYGKKLQKHGLLTMGDIARCSLGGAKDYYNEDLLYDLFGINAELLIDHAWGYEPCTIADVKNYKPSSNSIGTGQVLHSSYDFHKTRLVVREMADLLVLDLVDKGLITNQLVLTVGYDKDNLSDSAGNTNYKGAVTTDHYGRKIPKHAHGTVNLEEYTSSTKIIMEAVTELFDRIVNKKLLAKRVYITAVNVITESDLPKVKEFEQLDLFKDYQNDNDRKKEDEEELEREKNSQKAILEIKKKYGKNSILKGMNLEEGATTTERNNQIGGHKA